MSNELYRDFIDRKLDQIDGHLIDIYNAIGGGGPSAPIFTKTVLADNSSLSGTFTLSDDISNYDLIEFITVSASASYDNNRFLMTAGCINDILNLNTTNKLICFNDGGTNRYVAYTVNGNVYTRYNNRLINVAQVNGYKCTNKTVVEDVLFNTSTKSDAYINIPTTEDIYDYDMILFGYNDTDDDEIGPANNIFYPTDMIGGKNTYFNNNFYSSFYNTFIESNMLTNVRSVYVRGIKITGGNT